MRWKIFATVILLFFYCSLFSQSIWLVDFAKTKNNNRAEMLYYIEHNWKAYREVALQKGYITSYLLLEANADSAGHFDFILLTELPDSNAYKKLEENFAPIMKAQGPPKLLNSIPPNDFRQLVLFKTATTVFSSSKKNKKK